MYQVNDIIVYGVQGIYQVDSIVEMKLGKTKEAKMYYVLKDMFHQENKIYAPTDIKTVKMRKIISKNEAELLIEQISTIKPVSAEDEKSNQQVYQTLLNSIAPENWISLLKSISRKDTQRKEKGIKQLAQSDHHLKKVTESLLYGELSISLASSKEEIEAIMIKKIDTN